MCHALETAKAIGWALYHAHQHGQTPVGIRVDPATRDWMRDHEVGDWWRSEPTLFDLPVEVGTSGEGWEIRVR